MLKLILGMLSLVISRKSVVTKLKEASELYLVATTEEEKQAAMEKLIAFTLLFAEKFGKNTSPETMKGVVKVLESVNEEIQKREESEEEMEEIISEIAQVIGGNDEEDDEEFHIHDCDTCSGKGDCPIEQVMRDVKAGKLSPKEGDEAARKIVDNLENPLSPEEAIISPVGAEA